MIVSVFDLVMQCVIDFYYVYQRYCSVDSCYPSELTGDSLFLTAVYGLHPSPLCVCMPACMTRSVHRDSQSCDHVERSSK